MLIYTCRPGPQKVPYYAYILHNTAHIRIDRQGPEHCFYFTRQRRPEPTKGLRRQSRYSGQPGEKEQQQRYADQGNYQSGDGESARHLENPDK